MATLPSGVKGVNFEASVSMSFKSNFMTMPNDSSKEKLLTVIRPPKEREDKENNVRFSQKI